MVEKTIAAYREIGEQRVKKNKRIVHIIASKGMGGMETHVITLCNALAREHAIHVIAPEWMEVKFDSRVTFHSYSGITGSRFNIFSILKLRNMLRQINPDIVHVHGSKPASMITFPLLFNAFKRVATVHGMKTNVRLFRSFDHVIAVSDAVKRKIIQGNHSPEMPNKISTILNGIEYTPLPHRTRRSDHDVMTDRRSSGSPVVLAIGRLTTVKGFDVLIKAWVGVKAARLTIAGEGPERAHLEKMIRHYTLQDRVALLGHRADIRELLAQSDLMVISSRREGMPLVLAEALHAECPVVSTAVGGMVGFLPERAMTQAEDPEALARKINEVLADLPTYSKGLEPLYRFAKTEMTISVMAQKTELVYEHVMNRK